MVLGHRASNDVVGARGRLPSIREPRVPLGLYNVEFFSYARVAPFDLDISPDHVPDFNYNYVNIHVHVHDYDFDEEFL